MLSLTVLIPQLKSQFVVSLPSSAPVVEIRRLIAEQKLFDGGPHFGLLHQKSLLKESRGTWLVDLNRSLLASDVTTESFIVYKDRRRRLVVDLPNGTTASVVVDETHPVSKVLARIAADLLPWALTFLFSLQTDGKTLDPKLTLAANEVSPDSRLSLVPLRNQTAEEIAESEKLYKEYRTKVYKSLLALNQGEWCYLAAIEQKIQIAQSNDANLVIDKNSLFGTEWLCQCPDDMVADFTKRLDALLLPLYTLQQCFIKVCRSAESAEYSYFSVSEWRAGETDLIPFRLGVRRGLLIRVNPSTNRIEKRYLLARDSHWSSKRSLVRFEFAKSSAPSYAPSLVIQTQQADEIAQLLRGFSERHRRRRIRDRIQERQIVEQGNESGMSESDSCSTSASNSTEDLLTSNEDGLNNSSDGVALRVSSSATSIANSNSNASNRPALDIPALPPELRDLIFPRPKLRSLVPLRSVCKSWLQMVSKLRVVVSGAKRFSGTKLASIVSLFPYCSVMRLAPCTRLTPLHLARLHRLRDLHELVMPFNCTEAHITTLVTHTSLKSLRTFAIPQWNLPRPPVTPLFLQYVARLTNIQSLWLTAAPLKDSIRCVSALPRLTAVHILDISSDQTQGSLSEVFEKNPHSQLRTLHLSAPNTLRSKLLPEDIRCLSKFPQLRTLIFQFHQADLQSAFWELSALTALTALDLPSGTSLSPAAITSLTNLKRLPGNFWHSQELHYFSHLTQLEYIHTSPMMLADETCKALAFFPRLFSLLIPKSGANLSEVGLCHLTKLTRLNRLELVIGSLPIITDQILNWIVNLQNLRELALCTSAITPDSFVLFTRLNRLTTLSLRMSTITSEILSDLLPHLTALTNLALSAAVRSMEPVAAHLPQLTALDLTANPQVDDECIAPLTRLRRLKQLAIGGTLVSGVGFAGALFSHKLKTLKLEGASPVPLSVGGAEIISRELTRIVALHIPFKVAPVVLQALLSRQYAGLTLREITDEHVPALLNCSRLQVLKLLNSSVSPASLRSLLQALPNLGTFTIALPNGHVLHPLQTAAVPNQPHAPPPVKAPAPLPMDADHDD